MNVSAAERSVQAWIQRSQQNEIASVNNTLVALANETSFVFTLPTKVLKVGQLKYVTIGLQNCDLTNESDAISLFSGLIDFIKSEIHFFIFVFADDNKNVKGAIRIGERFLQRLKQMISGYADEEDEMATPLPIDVTDPTVILPADFILPAPESQNTTPYFKMMANVWKLNEYRNRLDVNNSIERSWLDDLEESYAACIRRDLEVSVVEGMELYQQVFVEDFLNSRIIPSPAEVVQLMLDRAAAMQGELLNGPSGETH